MEKRRGGSRECEAREKRVTKMIWKGEQRDLDTDKGI